MPRDEALIDKSDAQAQLVKAEHDMAKVTFKLQMTEANVVLAEKKATWSEEQWFTRWWTTQACDTYNAKVGHVSQKMGDDEALEWLKGVLAESCPSVKWNEIWSKYQDAYEADTTEIWAKIALEEDEEDEDNDDNDEAEASKAANVDAKPNFPFKCESQVASTFRTT